MSQLKVGIKRIVHHHIQHSQTLYIQALITHTSHLHIRFLPYYAAMRIINWRLLFGRNFMLENWCVKLLFFWSCELSHLMTSSINKIVAVGDLKLLYSFTIVSNITKFTVWDIIFSKSLIFLILLRLLLRFVWGFYEDLWQYEMCLRILETHWGVCQTVSCTSNDWFHFVTQKNSNSRVLI